MFFVRCHTRAPGPQRTCEHLSFVVKADPKRDERMDPGRLMAAIHDDDPAAFRELYDTYASDIRYGVRCFLRKVPRLVPHEDDIVGQAWVRLLARNRKQLRVFDPNKASFAHFLRMVGANTAWQEADQKKHPSWWSKEPAVEGHRGSRDTDVERIVGHRVLLEELNRRLEDGLSDREMIILKEVIVFRRPAKEVAQELGVATEVVWAATSRLRKKLDALTAGLRDEVPEQGQRSAKGAPLLLLLVFVSMTNVYCETNTLLRSESIDRESAVRHER